MCERVVIDFGFISDWMKNVRLFSLGQPCNTKPLTFQQSSARKRTALCTIKIHHSALLNIPNIYEYLETDQRQKTLSTATISIDIIPNRQNSLFTIIKNILISVNNG